MTENPHWLNNWLKLKAKQEEKDFNNLASVKKNIRTLCFIQQGYKGKVIIEDYPDLTQLNLGNNALEEIIIRNCPDLKLVQVAHNKLTKLKIENCPSVQEIYTHNNQLTKWDFPVEELKAKNLRTISYSDNPLTVEEKARLDSLGLPETEAKARVNGPAQDYLDAKYPWEERANTEKLDLSSLGLQGELNLEGFTNLKKLDVSDNELTNLDLNDCGKLEYLDASNNQIEEPDFLEGSKLETIILNHNKLTYFDNYESLNDSLKFLSLTANKLGNKIPGYDGHVGYLDVSGYKELEYLNCAIGRIREIDLSNNSKLNQLICYNNILKELEVNHLNELEYLFCQDNGLEDLDCHDLKKLKELNCSINLLKWDLLDLSGCDSLEILDCAENNLKKLDLSNLQNLSFISAKENNLREINADSPKITYLDISKQFINKNANIEIRDFYYPECYFGNSAKSIEKLFFFIPTDEFIREHPKSIIDWEKFPKLELVFNKNEIIDVLALQNTKKVVQVLNNPDNYSLEDLLKLEAKDLEGVEEELKDKLINLVKEKFKKEKRNFSPEENNERQNQIQTSISNIKTYWASKGITNIALADILGEDWEGFFADKTNMVEISNYETLLKNEIDWWVNLEQKREETPSLEKDDSSSEEEKETPPTTPPSENEDVYEFNEEEQKPFSLFDLEQLEQFFIQHKIKNVTLDSNNKLVVEYNNNNNNNKAELQQIFNYLKSNNKTSLSHSELKKIIAEKKKEQLPSTNPTNYLPYILGGTIIVLMIGVFVYLLGKRKKKLRD